MARRQKRRSPPALAPLTRAVVVSRPRVVRPKMSVRVLRTRVRAIEDRREFHPAGPLRFPKSLIKRPRLVLRDPSRLLRDAQRRAKATGKPVRMGDWSSPVMEVPHTVALCVRRKERREVILALRRGNGAAKKRRNEWSKVTC